MAVDAHDSFGVDTSIATPARMYDYWLGGHCNYAADRAMAELAVKHFPQSRDVAVHNRAFLGRAVRFCAQQGIRQFLDIGSGLPTQQNVHHVAQTVDPETRVVYVDNDPIVLAHGRALLAENDRTGYFEADVRDPRLILDAAGTRALIDFDQPVGLVLCAVLHFVPDADDPAALVRTYLSALAPGSMLVLSHVCVDGTDPELLVRIADSYANQAIKLHLRTRETIAEMTDGMDVFDPGLVDAVNWRPDREEGLRDLQLLGCVARVR